MLKFIQKPSCHIHLGLLSSCLIRQRKNLFSGQLSKMGEPFSTRQKLAVLCRLPLRSMHTGRFTLLFESFTVSIHGRMSDIDWGP